MKKYFSILLIVISCSMQAQELVEIPPGTIRINDSLYIDKGPVDNIMYSEFTSNVETFWTYTLHDSLKKLELENIDSSLLSHSLNKDQNKEIFKKTTIAKNLNLPGDVDIYNYFNHPEYKYHPVIGISKSLAQLFCQWRTDMVNLRWSIKLKNNHNYSKIKYRLPTPEEYKLAKDHFDENHKLVEIDKKSPLEIDLEEMRKKDNFILFNTPEFTSTNQNHEEGVKSSDKIKQTANNYIFFRCICEPDK